LSRFGELEEPLADLSLVILLSLFADAVLYFLPPISATNIQMESKIEPGFLIGVGVMTIGLAAFVLRSEAYGGAVDLDRLEPYVGRGLFARLLSPNFVALAGWVVLVVVTLTWSVTIGSPLKYCVLPFLFVYLDREFAKDYLQHREMSDYLLWQLMRGIHQRTAEVLDSAVQAHGRNASCALYLRSRRGDELVKHVWIGEPPDTDRVLPADSDGIEAMVARTGQHRKELSHFDFSSVTKAGHRESSRYQAQQLTWVFPLGPKDTNDLPAGVLRLRCVVEEPTVPFLDQQLCALGCVGQYFADMTWPLLLTGPVRADCGRILAP